MKAGVGNLNHKKIDNYIPVVRYLIVDLGSPGHPRAGGEVVDHLLGGTSLYLIVDLGSPGHPGAGGEVVDHLLGGQRLVLVPVVLLKQLR